MQPCCDKVARLLATACKGRVCPIGFQTSNRVSVVNCYGWKHNNLLSPSCKQPPFRAGGWGSSSLPGCGGVFPASTSDETWLWTGSVVAKLCRPCCDTVS